jgi:hypothetical protein
MTNVISDMSGINLETQLLSISTATLIANNDCWVQTFRETYGRSGFDMKDIGAIGLDVNFSGKGDHQYARIDSKGADFGEDSLYKLVSAAFTPELMYSMDIPETGDLSWVQNVFLEAARGDKASIAAIIESADILTGGNFSAIYEGGNPMTQEVNRIHLGYYIDQDGNKQDIRDLDYLALLNFEGEREPTLVADFANTYDRLEMDTAQRLFRRLAIIRGDLGGTVKLTGYGQRVTFNPNFIVTLAQAIANGGLRPNPENIFHRHAATERGNMNAHQYAMAGGNIGGMWSFGNTGPGAINHAMGARTGGWR